MRSRTRRQRAAALLVMAVLRFTSLPVWAGEVKIVAHSSLGTDTISPAEIKRIFLLEENSLDDGSHVLPVLQKHGPAHEAFLREFLDTNEDALRTYYRTLVFTGKSSMPKELGSDAEIVSYVARTKGAIGYVSAHTLAEGVKTLAVVGASSKLQRTLRTRVEPQYPETLRRLKIGGVVRLQVTIAPNGTVENVQLLGGNPILAESAISAVKQWIYSPAHARTITELEIPFESPP